ncbi:pentapeptide repeat-containing protein [Salmonella enterica]|nr:pentapeptide repeat-containing protein [Salmonella enterica subsp. enterica serovar Newport]ECG4839208.1 hypothetical protein [Salmonella enterica subsp. enterica serovar Newport]EHD9606070.1 pentapeptide repeat-containing protein [Salmonella enterica]EIK8153599.1 pentapeptide repeat-containing protein [Salmonella enterica]EJI8189031.1 pentapeptide repeat-containing protein [Salmonella enterica]
MCWSGCEASGQEGVLLTCGSCFDFTDGSPPDSDGSKPPFLPDFDGSDFDGSDFDGSDFDGSDFDASDSDGSDFDWSGSDR